MCSWSRLSKRLEIANLTRASSTHQYRPFLPNSLGSTRLQTRTNAAAAASDAAKKLDTNLVLVEAPLPRSSGRSGGSTIVRHAVNMDAAALKLLVTWSAR
jgi:hypothetical protein